MKYAQIKDELIKNVILVEEGASLEQFSSGYDDLVRIDNITPIPGINWSYDGNNFSAPTTPPEPIADVTPRQIRQALILYGVSLASIDAALNTLSEPTKSLAKTEWEYSIAFQRNRPLVTQVGQMLGWTTEQLDALWIFAASL